MKFSTLLSLCLCVLYMCSKSLGSVFLTERDLKQTRGKFCGPNLSNALSVVCRGKYNSPRPQQQKKSMYEDNEEFVDYPFTRKRSAYSLFTNEVRKRGIIEECCFVSCSLMELRSYCR